MKKIIKIKDIDSMYLAGPSDKNIKFIETKFKSTIVLRGNELLVNGSKEEIQVLQRLVIDMVNAITRKESVSTSDIEILLQSQGEDANKENETLVDERIVLHTHKDPVYAKTKGQKKYHKAVLDNDIVFAIGPAGTGKTYQAVACAVSALKNKEVDRIIGYLPPDDYLQKLNQISRGENTIDDLLTKYNQNQNPSTLSLLGKKYYEKGDYDNAKSRYKELISTFTNADKNLLDEAKFQLSSIQYYNGDISGLENYINQNTNSEFTQSALSMIKRYFKSKDDVENELKAYNKSLLYFPNDPNILNSYAWRMTELNMNLEDALIKVNRAIILTEDEKQKQANIIDTKAEIEWKLGRIDDAIRTIEEAILLVPDNDYFTEQKNKFLNSK